MTSSSEIISAETRVRREKLLIDRLGTRCMKGERSEKNKKNTILYLKLTEKISGMHSESVNYLLDKYPELSLSLIHTGNGRLLVSDSLSFQKVTFLMSWALDSIPSGRIPSIASSIYFSGLNACPSMAQIFLDFYIPKLDYQDFFRALQKVPVPIDHLSVKKISEYLERLKNKNYSQYLSGHEVFYNQVSLPPRYSILPSNLEVYDFLAESVKIIQNRILAASQKESA